MTIADLRDHHLGRPAFCLGTAPHLADLPLHELRDHVTIACNQLVLQAEELQVDYVCFQRNARFHPLRDQLPDTGQTCFVVPTNVLDKNRDWNPSDSVADRLVPIDTRFATPKHESFLSLDLADCAYVGNVISLEVQLAVWLGCNPIYLIGVDGQVREAGDPLYSTQAPGDVDAEKAKTYHFPELAEWLRKAHAFLQARDIDLYNAAGPLSNLDALPRMRFRAALGDPLIAVTSKTFSQDAYLVRELQRFFPRVVTNDYDGKLAHGQLVDYLAEADGVILGTEPFSADVIEQLPYLRFVSKYGVGLDNVDFAAADQHQVNVAYRKGVNSDSVGELTIAQTIALLRRIDPSVQGYRGGKWKKLPGLELAEITVGIVGYGHVGKVVARKFAALGVGRLLVNDLVDVQPEQPAEDVSLDYLLAEADVISLHISMEAGNYHLVDAGFLASMKPGSYLVNTSRGEIIDEAALADALQRHHLAGAALDVYEHEPVINETLVACPNLLTTCHIAGSSNRAIKNMGWAAIEELLALFRREPS